MNFGAVVVLYQYLENITVSIQSIYASAFSSVAIGRGLYADRPFGSNSTDDTQKSKNPSNSGQVGSVIETTRHAPGTVEEPKSPTKSGDKPQKHSPAEKSNDAGKTRSASGDILDISQETKKTESKNETNSAKEVEKNESSRSPQELTEEEKHQITQLKARDAEVRAHEAAHLAAAGSYARGGASFEYQTGPDGKKYAIGGEVSIDSGPVSGDPAATIQKARQIRAAALAPASPSSQDQKVAAAASQMEADARIQLNREKAEAMKQLAGSNSSDSDEAQTEAVAVGQYMFNSSKSDSNQLGPEKPNLQSKKSNGKSMTQQLLDSVKESDKSGAESRSESLARKANLTSNSVSTQYVKQQSTSFGSSFVAFA